MKRLRWQVPDRPVPRHPFRDSAILYAVMAVLIVVVSVATGGAVGRAVVVAVLFWVVAMAWAAMRFRQRLDKEKRK